MKWITHIAFAFVVVKIVEIVFLIDLLDSPLAYAIVSTFAILPDIDVMIGLKHRTYTHTVYFTLIALILLPINPKLALIGWISIFSHLVADMMTSSGVKLFYPKKTVFYLLPPEWRLRTGGSGEFAILGVLIIASLLIANVAEASELQRVLKLSDENEVTVKISYFENNVIHELESVEIAWTDRKDRIGIIKDGRFKMISSKDILRLEILKIEKVERLTKEKRVKVKELKRSIWKKRLVVGYEDDESYHDFLGTGYDLYLKFKKNESVKLKVWYVCESLRSSPDSTGTNSIQRSFTSLQNSISAVQRFIGGLTNLSSWG